MPQTTWNKATVPAGTDPYNEIPDMKKGIETLNAVVPVASASERDALLPPGGKYTGMLVYRTDLGRLERWTGARWAQVSNTELGHTNTGLGGTLVATPSWSDILIVTATSLGGECVIDYRMTLANANSGAHRETALRVVCDGVEIDGRTFNSPWISGIDLPTFAALEVFHTPSAGSHTWKLQGNAAVAGAIQVRWGSMSVTEKP